MLVESPDRAQDDDPPWSHLLSHRLWEAATRLNLLADAALADSPLSLAALGLLDHIATWPGITIAEISRRTPKRQQTISQIIARLQKLGYIERRLLSGRGVGLYITPAGQQAHRAATAKHDTVEQFLQEHLSEEDYEQLRVLLGNVSALLSQ